MAAVEILGEARDVETIVVGRGVYIRRYLERAYGARPLPPLQGLALVGRSDNTQSGRAATCHRDLLPAIGEGLRKRYRHPPRVKPNCTVFHDKLYLVHYSYWHPILWHDLLCEECLLNENTFH
jgi:hypothetical protein